MVGELREDVDFCFVGGVVEDNGCLKGEDDRFEEEVCFARPVVATEMAESCGEGGGYILAMERRSTSSAQQVDVN